MVKSAQPMNTAAPDMPAWTLTEVVSPFSTFPFVSSSGLLFNAMELFTFYSVVIFCSLCIFYCSNQEKGLLWSRLWLVKLSFQIWNYFCADIPSQFRLW